MTIVIQSSSYSGGYGSYTDLQRAFVALHLAKISPLGGGRFADGTGYIVLRQETEAPAALDALAQLGIVAVQLLPKPSLKRPAKRTVGALSVK